MFRSQIAELWFPYDRTIAVDRTLGSRVGAVVRALASHQCVPGSIPGPGVICGLSLLLVLYSPSRGFSPVSPVFPSPQKPTFLDLDFCQALYHEPLARVIAQTLPMFDVSKFTFTNLHLVRWTKSWLNLSGHCGRCWAILVLRVQPLLSKWDFHNKDWPIPLILRMRISGVQKGLSYDSYLV